MKSNFKKVSSLLLVAIMAASVFSGCGNQNGTSSESSTDSSTSSTESSASSTETTELVPTVLSTVLLPVSPVTWATLGGPTMPTMLFCVT